MQAALEKGLRKIVFLEHMEEGIRPFAGRTWLTEEDFEDYFTEGRRLQSKYAGLLDIGLGVECGYNPEQSDKLIRRLGQRCWDQIGISCHFMKVSGMANHLNMFSRKSENIQLALQVGPEKILGYYFAALTEAVRLLPGTMLCHLDGALRYVPEIRLSESHYRQIDSLFQMVKERGMALEINSSGLAIRQEQFPNSRIIATAKSYGIPLVLGSDAHRPENVGRCFDRLAALFSE